MGKKHYFFFLLISLMFLASSLSAEEEDLNINIKVSLFKGTWDKSQKGIEKEVVMTTSSYPEVAYLKDKALGPEQGYIAAVMETLVDTMDLQGIEELGLLKDYYWHVTETSFISTIWRKEAAFQFILVPKRLSAQRFNLRTIINRTKDSYIDSIKEKSKGDPSISAVVRGYVDRIYERELMVNVDEPVLVGIPYKDTAYFISILIPGLENPNPSIRSCLFIRKGLKKKE